jgi:lipopolysaccharide/colanic/teichoic acid biosynthesis glycosyltransferase
MWEYRKRFRRLRDLLSIEYIDDERGPNMKAPNDPRVASGFARFCRQHSLDELPQLILVVTGRMSLIGPRPVTPAELAEIYGPDAPEIVSVKPGISGLWQVSGRNRLSSDERHLLDLKCLRNRSTRFYLAIILRTVPEVLWGRNTF